MPRFNRTFRFSARVAAPLCLTAILLTGCGEQPEARSSGTNTDGEAVNLVVYKSPTCGCCGAWVEHIDAHDFTSEVRHPENLSAVKTRLGISPGVQACHTAVTSEGYVFEGHVPAKTMQRFLADPPPDALGLAVPGMPVGSPGMESGDQFMAYQVLLLKNDGTMEVFADFQSAAEQY